MNHRRTAKVAQAVRQVVSSAILTELRDPRVRQVTVLNVEVPADLRSAKVYVSVLGDEKATRLSLQGLSAARGWLQKRIADELDLRWTPVLTFVIDEGVKKSIATSRLLREIQEAEATAEDEVEPDESSDDSNDAPEANQDSG
jgi:ribosome-binding factor A